MVYLVEFIDEQDAGLVVLKGKQKWSCAEELPAPQDQGQFAPIYCLRPSLVLDKEPLQRLVKFADGFPFVDAFIFSMNSCRNAKARAGSSVPLDA